MSSRPMRKQGLLEHFNYEFESPGRNSFGLIISTRSETQFFTYSQPELPPAIFTP